MCIYYATNAESSLSFIIKYVVTVEPPNKGHVGTRSFVLYREVSFFGGLKCTGIIRIGMGRFVVYREVFFIPSVLYRRFHCSWTHL